MIDFPRYLTAKKSIDDRAINRFVWEQLVLALSTQSLHRPLRVLELGCGIGTMVERLLAWGLAEKITYLGIDTQAENLQVAKNSLRIWGQENGYQVGVNSSEITLEKGEVSWRISFQQADATSFQATHGFYDLLLANAFLDLINIPTGLSDFASWLQPQGLFYFTINFDGETIFEPVSKVEGERRIIDLYHQSMDDRLLDGQPSGDSRTGRHLFTNLKATGAQILAAGASDWVVFPGDKGYPEDEAYFLHCILDFFESTLENNPVLEQEELAAWLAERRHQINHNDLVYIAHQLDFLGSFPQ
jgi:SAM-dependent methyltransferase